MAPWKTDKIELIRLLCEAASNKINFILCVTDGQITRLSD